MPTRTLPKRFDLSTFNALIIKQNRKTGYLNLYISAAEEEEIDRLTEEEFRNNYEAEYKMACDKSEDHWYPYRAAEVLENQLIDFWKSGDVDKILKHRWSSLRKEIQSKYVSEQIMPELNKAVQRRAILEAKYETECGFRVKSRGEQAIANALRFYTITYRNTGECKRVNLLYEPLIRIPNENRIVIPDFVIPEYGVILEYAGLEERNYKLGLLMKIEAFRQLGVPVVVMRPEDLADVKNSLQQKLKFYFNLEEQESKPF